MGHETPNSKQEKAARAELKRKESLERSRKALADADSARRDKISKRQLRREEEAERRTDKLNRRSRWF